MPRLFTIICCTVVLICSQSMQAQRWQKVTLPAGYNSSYYLDVFFLPSDQLFGWACDNDSGFVVRTTDGGNTWRGSRVGAAGQFCHLEYIQFLDKSVGYCSGPCGVFKSTDGGATWARLTLAATAVNQWGAWFKTTTEGWVTGGGCGVNNFYHTTDGGQNFTLYSDTLIKRSNLSDPLWNSQMAADNVFAIGNGTLWKSTDNGTNWAVSSYTGNNSPWHEELSMAGSTICVPSATSNCATGGFTGGSIRTSTDNGTTWTETMTTGDMFGTCLLTEYKGWAAGRSANVWYTSDRGASWSLRNCGLEGAHTDDIFFMNDSTGWVAGSGLFRLARALRTQDDTALAFKQACPNTSNKDTVFITNVNFFPSNWTVGITGADADQFRIVNAPLPGQIASCAPQAIIVEYLATRSGSHVAQLLITIRSPDTALTVNLTGDRRSRTGYPIDTLISINVRVGQTIDQQMLWSASGRPVEQILLIDRVSGDTSINIIGTIPVTLEPPPLNAFTVIRATARDTGWTSARFKVIIGPCLRDTFITVRMYGQSPIISTSAAAAVDAKCKSSDTLRIPVSNTGNFQLTISSIRTEALGKNAFTVIGFVSGRPPNPYVLPIGTVDTLLVLYTPKTGNDVADVVFDHDDMTTARNVARPLRVPVRGISARPQISLETNIIDFGKICVNSLAEKGWTLANVGTGLASVSFQHASSRVGGFPANPSDVTSGQTKSYRISFSSATVGVIRDTVWMLATPCDTMQMIIVTATVVDSRIVITPSQIVESVNSGITIVRNAVVSLVGTDAATITSISVVPQPANLTVTYPPLPYAITGGGTLTIVLTYTGIVNETYDGKITVNGTGLCKSQAEAEVTFESGDRGLELSKRNVVLVQQCGPGVLYDTVLVSAKDSPVTIDVPIVLAPQNGFAIVAPLTQTTIEKGKPLAVVVSYLPTARGSFNATLEVAELNGGQKYLVALQGSLIVSDIQLSMKAIDYGRVEACSPDSTVTISITNASDFIESVSIEQVSLQPGCTTVAQQIQIPMGQTRTIDVVCRPSQTSAGVTNGSFVIRELRCGEEQEVTVVVDNVSGKLTMLPATVTYKTLLPGQTETKQVTITNNTGAVRTVVDLVVDAATEPFSITPDIRGRVLSPGQQVTVQVTYAPVNAGDNNARLVLTEKDICISTVSSALFGIARSYVTPPQYNVELWVDEYIAPPGATVRVPVHWKTDVRLALIDTLETELEFYGLLYQLDTVLAGDMPDALVTTVQEDGRLNISVVRDGPNMGLPGIVCTMVGTAFSALPDSTGFNFVNNRVVAGEDVKVNTDDGWLVVDACGPRFLIKLGAAAEFRILPPNPSQYEVHVEIKANIPQAVQIDFINNVGRVIPSPFAETFATGTYVRQVPIEFLANGLYSMRFTTSVGGVYLITLPVLR